MQSQAKQSLLNGFDPLLGYTYSDSTYLPLNKAKEDHLNGITRIGRNANKDIRIAILGGSTSDISYEGNWMRELYSLLESQNLKPLLICAGISGYSTSQELIKLIRDVLPLKPHVVISLSGVNDMGFIQACSTLNPYIHPYQKSIGEFFTQKAAVHKEQKSSFFQQKLPLKRDELRGMNGEMPLGNLVLGVEKQQESYESWHTNIRLQKAVCSEFGLKYFACLQPIFGFGEYEASEEEKLTYEIFLQQRYVHRVPYQDTLERFFSGAKEIAITHQEYICDLTDIFADAKEVYQDPRHLNTYGNTILASRVFEILLNKGLIPNKEVLDG